jgi:hypothetical protein
MSDQSLYNPLDVEQRIEIYKSNLIAHFSMLQRITRSMGKEENEGELYQSEFYDGAVCAFGIVIKFLEGNYVSLDRLVDLLKM